MSDNCGSVRANCDFKDGVCIHTDQVYDSCKEIHGTSYETAARQKHEKLQRGYNSGKK